MKKMFVSVRGKANNWDFEFYGDPKHLAAWQEDGIEVYVLENEIPLWAAELRLTKIWCFFQDLFNFKNPFKN